MSIRKKYLTHTNKHKVMYQMNVFCFLMFTVFMECVKERNAPEDM